ncbi:protein translocase subunit SecD [Patescibacteria group bacterium]|nr:protein translocase subunit SecD [Patescibacteria group bacterium]
MTKRLKRNLSLAGIFLLVVLAVLIDLPNGPDIKTKDGISEIKLHLGLDFQGGTHLTYQADVSNIETADRSNAVEGVRDVLERRINAFGVSEPVVQTSKVDSNYRVLVELPGITNITEATEMIGETPLLEFKEQVDPEAIELTEEQKKEMSDFNLESKNNAENLISKINSDSISFDEAFSENEGSDLEFISETGPYADFYSSLSNLKNGEVLDTVVENQEGYNILKRVDDRNTEKQVEAYHILIAYKDALRSEATRSKNEALELAKNLRSDFLLSSRDREDYFKELATSNSNDPSVTSNSGYLGWFAKGDMVPEFEDVVFDMANSDVSDVVETDFGYHIIYKKDEKPLSEIKVSRILFEKKTKYDYINYSDPWINTQLSGKNLDGASVNFDQMTGEPNVSLDFDSEGGDLFADITERNVGKQVAIFLDGTVISAPRVDEPITSGSAVINGAFTVSEAKLLAMRLNSGALPVPITLISQKNIGPTLGEISVEKSIKAFIFGILAVALFMIIFYKIPGVIANLSLLFYALIVLAFYKMIPVTLTLAGATGFILSIGMAVDANVLIFERVREELRNKRTLKDSIDIGFKRAWTSIRDGNISTLITCFVLYAFGTSIVKGFGLTLGLGVLVSMFTSYVVTKLLLQLVSNLKISKKLWH